MPNESETKVNKQSGTPLEIGDQCWICEGRCRFGQCPDCGGHSEHNYGCVQTTTHDPARKD